MNKKNIRNAYSWLEHLENLQHVLKDKAYCFLLTGLGHGLCFEYEEELATIEKEAENKLTKFLKEEAEKYEKAIEELE